RHAPAGALKSRLHRVVDFLSPSSPDSGAVHPRYVHHSVAATANKVTLKVTVPRISGFDTDFQPGPPAESRLKAKRCRLAPAGSGLDISRKRSSPPPPCGSRVSRLKQAGALPRVSSCRAGEAHAIPRMCR